MSNYVDGRKVPFTPPNYSNPDLTSKPAPGAIEIDATHATLVCDMVSSDENFYHFEIGLDGGREVPSRHTDNPSLGGKVFVQMIFESRIAA